MPGNTAEAAGLGTWKLTDRDLRERDRGSWSGALETALMTALLGGGVCVFALKVLPLAASYSSRFPF